MKTDIDPLSAPRPSGKTDLVRACGAEGIGIVLEAGEYRLVATRPAAVGERLFWMEGKLTAQPSRYSVQVGDHLHLAPGEKPSAEEPLDRYFWRFMNHSCHPNTVIREREVFACRDIQPGDAVTFDYNTTEWEMAEPFRCRCGSASCLKEIRGFKHLTAAQRDRLPLVGPHLLRSGLLESLAVT